MTQLTQTAKKGNLRQIAIPIGKKKLTSSLCTTRPNTDFEAHPKSRYYFIRTYLPYEAFVQLFSSCKAWAYIKHDQDDKQVHHHLLLAYTNAKFLTGIADDIYKLAITHPVDGQPQASYIEIPQSLPHCFAYLTHSDPSSVKAGKHRYSDSEVIGENLSVFGSSDTCRGKANAVDIIDDINEGVSYREMARKYGTFFVTNFGRFKQYSELVTMEETSHQHDPVAVAFREYLSGEREAFSLISCIVEHEAYKLTFDKKMTDIEKGYRDKQNRSEISRIEGIYSDKLTEWRSVLNDQKALGDLVNLSKVAESSASPCSDCQDSRQSQQGEPLDIPDHLKEIKYDCLLLEEACKPIDIFPPEHRKNHIEFAESVIQEVKERCS